MRRKFDEALKAQPDVTGNAKTALAFIRELYAVERALSEREPPITAEQRVAARQERSRPLVERFRTWLEALEPQVLPESRLGKALRYTLGQWPKLTVFLEHGAVPLDNNRCENAIRPFVIGRKGWLFSDTVPGARERDSLLAARDRQSQRPRAARVPVHRVRPPAASDHRRGVRSAAAVEPESSVGIFVRPRR